MSTFKTVEVIDDMEQDPYPIDINKFARIIIWFQPAEYTINHKNQFLLYIMRTPQNLAYLHAKKYYGYTDEDFRQALYNAEPGIIMYEHIWELWNKRLNIDPPLPFPKKKFFCDMEKDNV